MKFLVLFAVGICFIATDRLSCQAAKFLTYPDEPCDFCNGTHVACNLTLKFSSNCYPNARVEPMPQEMRNMILDKHNSCRNLLAGGNVNGYSPAIRMASMQWCVEFEYLALLNLLQCQMAHDKCRSTPDCPYSGQNLGYIKYRGQNFTNAEVFSILFDYWFAEHKDSSMADISAYPYRSQPMIGHFAMLGQERANCVGCSMISQTNVTTNIKEVYLACNYSYNNVYTMPVYRQGTTASACTTGTHPVYRNLCSLNEPYNLKSLRY